MEGRAPSQNIVLKGLWDIHTQIRLKDIFGRETAKPWFRPWLSMQVIESNLAIIKTMRITDQMSMQ